MAHVTDVDLPLCPVVPDDGAPPLGRGDPPEAPGGTVASRKTAVLFMSLTEALAACGYRLAR